MKKLSGPELFYICDKCKHPNRIELQAEFLLQYLKHLNCEACGHKHVDIEDLKNYSKSTRGYQ